jgi:beta-lactamase regulating signal transducer with metallopeptidase domain
MTLLESIFYTVLDQSWKVAVVVLLLLAIRRHFGQHLSPTVRHALWIFVALAALTPGALVPRPTIWLREPATVSPVETADSRRQTAAENNVIPAKAGIQTLDVNINSLDPSLRWGDGKRYKIFQRRSTFLRASPKTGVAGRNGFGHLPT